MPLWSNTTPTVVNHIGALDGQPAPPNSLEAVAAERDANDLPRTLGAYGYYDDHFLAAGRTWHSTADYLRDRSESLLLAVPLVSVLYLRYTLIAQSLADGFSWAECCHAHGVQLDNQHAARTGSTAWHQTWRRLVSNVNKVLLLR
jgi:hypothetical protein